MSLALEVAMAVVLAYALYICGVGLFGVINPPRERQIAPRNRFCIIVPAHNEEMVLGNLLDSIEALEYPRHLYDVVVVADNCTDRTAEVARSRGVQVLERYDDENKGKGYALEYAFSELGFTRDREPTGSFYDAAVVFDADNLVQPNFLTVMNTRLLSGEHLIQSFLDSKNPDDTWISAAYSILFWVNNRFVLFARHRLGLSAAFMGTGMCISHQALRDIGWKTRTLTEDLEYSIQGVLHGYRTTYAHYTRVYDEKPLTFAASCRQRLRWARGQLSVFYYYVAHLFRGGFRDRDPVQLEAGLRLCQLAYLIAAPLIMWSYGAADIEGITFSFVSSVPVLPLLIAYFPYLFMGLLFIVDNHPKSVIKYTPLYPAFTFSWAAILVVGMFTAHRREWMPTRHTRAMSLARVLTKGGEEEMLAELSHPEAHREHRHPDSSPGTSRSAVNYSLTTYPLAGL